MILLRTAQMLCQIFNPLAQQRNLHTRVAGVRFIAAESGCELTGLLWGKSAHRTTQASSTRLLRGRQGPRRLNVGGHLKLQRVNAVEALFAAQTLKKLNPQLLPIKVSVEIKQVGLNQFA